MPRTPLRSKPSLAPSYTSPTPLAAVPIQSFRRSDRGAEPSIPESFKASLVAATANCAKRPRCLVRRGLTGDEVLPEGFFPDSVRGDHSEASDHHTTSSHPHLHVSGCRTSKS